jgi:hypothetical protein
LALPQKSTLPILTNFQMDHGQFLARDNFSNRLEKGEPIYIHETFYALMQGYDAVSMETDVQIGGSDQLFNIIVAGRKLQEALGQRPLVGIITAILPGTDGVQRMSKSTGNIVPINTGANDMFGKLMSVPDSAMSLYMRLVTRWSPHEIEQIEKDMASGALHPRDAKMKMAGEIESSPGTNCKSACASARGLASPDSAFMGSVRVVEANDAASLQEHIGAWEALVAAAGVRKSVNKMFGARGDRARVANAVIKLVSLLACRPYNSSLVSKCRGAW